ncbi:aminopeptidase P [Coprinopsis cinerea AmutBmut pab1-1]|nr:aminopeptidase P [Coprinopsis cinerea AmutBmut pab1-1]
MRTTTRYPRSTTLPKRRDNLAKRSLDLPPKLTHGPGSPLPIHICLGARGGARLNFLVRISSGISESTCQSFQKPDKGVPEEIAKESSQTSVGTMPDGVVSLLSVDYNPVVRTPVDDVKAVNDAAEIEDFRQSHIWNGALARYFRVPRGEGATTSSDWDKSGIPDKPLVRWADDDIQSLFPALLILRISRSQVSETSDASTAPC